MKLTEQDKERLRHLANVFNAAADGGELRTMVGGVPFDGPETIEELLTSIKVGADIRIIASQPLPGPNPGGVTSDELGEGWELVAQEEARLPGCQWMDFDRKWRSDMPEIDTASWRRPKKQEPCPFGHQPGPFTECPFGGHPVPFAQLYKAAQDAAGVRQPTPPDPGSRHRLVDTKTEQPRDDAEVWYGSRGWQKRGALAAVPYSSFCHYRVPLIRRLVQPTAEELRGAWVRMSGWGEDAELCISRIKPKECMWSTNDYYWFKFDDNLWMTNGLRTDPADPSRWIPWAKEVWE